MMTVKLTYVQEWCCSGRTGLRQLSVFRTQNAFTGCSEESNCVLHFQRDVTVQTCACKTWHEQTNMQTAEIHGISRQMAWPCAAGLHDSLHRETQISVCSGDQAAFLGILHLLGGEGTCAQGTSQICILLQCTQSSIAVRPALNMAPFTNGQKHPDKCHSFKHAGWAESLLKPKSMSLDWHR